MFKILTQKVLAKEGLEPSTFALLARRSNRLSYSAAGSCVYMRGI